MVVNEYRISVLSRKLLPIKEAKKDLIPMLILLSSMSFLFSRIIVFRSFTALDLLILKVSCRAPVKYRQSEKKSGQTNAKNKHK